MILFARNIIPLFIGAAATITFVEPPVAMVFPTVGWALPTSPKSGLMKI